MKYLLLTLSAVMILGGCASASQKDLFCRHLSETSKNGEPQYREKSMHTSVNLYGKGDQSENCMVITNGGTEWAF